MATLADIRALVQGDVRDINAAVFSTTEINAWINQALDAVSDILPLETTEALTISASVYTYAPSNAFDDIFRVDVHDASDVYVKQLPRGSGDRTTGWDLFASILYLPPQIALTTGHTYHLYGYTRYAQLASDGTVSDAPTKVINAVRVFCQKEAFRLLATDRATFTQWQAAPGNSNVSETEIEQMRRGAFATWNDERQRLRSMRRVE